MELSLPGAKVPRSESSSIHSPGGATIFCHFCIVFVVLILSPPKPQLCTRVPIVSQLHFPINKLVWNIHNNTNSTDFSHFWGNLGVFRRCSLILILGDTGIPTVKCQTTAYSAKPITSRCISKPSNPGSNCKSYTTVEEALLYLTISTSFCICFIFIFTQNDIPPSQHNIIHQPFTGVLTSSLRGPNLVHSLMRETVSIHTICN